MVSWSALNEGRRTTRSRWPTIWRLPLIDRSTRYAAAAIRPGERVLDIGASDGRFRKRLPEGAEYRTLDVDPEMDIDYRSIEEVEEGSFDVVTSFECIEHLTLDEAHAVFTGAARVLKPDGRLFVSTPNVHHPWAYLRSCTHVTPFCYAELGGLLHVCGFELDGLFRCHRDAVLKRGLRWLATPVYRATGIDFAKSILAAAHVSK